MTEPSLVLQPALTDMSREELEAYLTEVRTRRMLAAIEYVAGQNMKIAHESEKVQRKIKSQYEMLAKEIMKLDAADEKVQARMMAIEMLKQELGILSDQIDTTATDV